MATPVPARLTRGEGRRFGFVLGGAFLAIAAVSWWRGHAGMSAAVGGLGLTLALAGLLIPTRLGPVERVWMTLARAISKLTTPVVMAILYLLVITPVGVARRLLAGNPLIHEAVSDSFWKRRARGSSNLHRQF